LNKIIDTEKVNIWPDNIHTGKIKFYEGYKEMCEPFDYVNWKPQLACASFETMVHYCTPEEHAWLCVMLAQQDEGIFNMHKAAIASLDGIFAKALERFPEGLIVKVGLRSPKDSWYGMGLARNQPGNHSTAILKTVKDIKNILYDSERIYEDANAFRENGMQLTIQFRKAAFIQPLEEWRCFWFNGRLRAISQYYYSGQHVFEWPPTSSVIAIRTLVNGVGQWLPNNAIVDVWVPPIESPTVIEINPYFKSDPCLFDYEKDKDILSGKFKSVVVRYFTKRMVEIAIKNGN